MNIDDFRELRELAGNFHAWVIVLRLLARRIRPLAFPVLFALRVSLMTFGLLLLMPTHPIAIPAAFGGALSINLLIH